MPAWQTWVVIVLTVCDFVIAQTLANATDLGLANAKWLLIVLLPAVSMAITLAANQLKAIGSPPPGVPLTERTAKPPQP